ncbi:MAG: hypothetical protein ACC656_03800 [Candidatus Heimdallarchaeota archaeon]
MAFKHIQSNRLVFLLTEEGTPTGFKIGNEDIPKGSLCVDIDNLKLYMFTGTSWKELGTGTAEVDETITVYETPAVSGTSGWVFSIGTGTNVLQPLANTLFFYVNTQKAVVDVDWAYDSYSQEIHWISTSYDLEENDLIEIYYQVKLPI